MSTGEMIQVWSRIITVTSQKGGVGKTTTATTIAHGLARRDANVLLIDFDPQGHSAIALGLDPEPGVFDWLVGQRNPLQCVWDTGRHGLKLLPSNSRTRTVQTVLHAEMRGLSEVTGAIKTLAQRYDFVVIDTPPSGILQEAAIACADAVLIPVHCEALALDGVAATMNVIKQIGNPDQIAIIPTSYDTRLNEHGYNLGLLRKTYSGMVVRPVLQRVAVAQCHAEGKTVYECDSVGARDVAMAYDEVIGWLVATDEEILFGDQSL